MSTGGTYTLVVAVPEPLTLSVGALGDCRVPAGGYAYTGSALGSGGFARVDRHRRVAAGENDVRHWHVDSLLGHPRTAVATVVQTADRDLECRVARALGPGPVEGFGASDCGCPSHLARRRSVRAVRRAAARAHRDAARAADPDVDGRER
jgi:endonuclease-3